jgi:hypothetical protein
MHMPSPQFIRQPPQSPGQLTQFSPPLHEPSPQTGVHEPQSSEQVAQVSPANPSQTMSPQKPQLPQSTAQVKQSSPIVGWQMKSPQKPVHGPQSVGHPKQSSGQVQVPSPHTGQAPQSPGQVEQVSELPQKPSPHTGHGPPQSIGQVAHPSVGPHAPSPQMPPQSTPQLSSASPTQRLSHVDVQQNGSMAQTVATHGSQVDGRAAPGVQMSCGQVHEPQSLAQLEQVSPRPQVPLPQAESHGSPQIDAASLAHRPSHEKLQQKKSTAQTEVTHGLQPSTRAEPTRHSSCVHVPVQVPQSPMHVAQVSPGPQTPSPQVPGQAPQSAGQVPHPSVGPSQMPFGHVVGQMPQSPGQVEQLSLPEQVKSPQVPGQVEPHRVRASLTQAPSQLNMQQKESTAQTVEAHGSHEAGRATPVVHGECGQAQVPQSAGQVEQLSVAPQVPFGQPGGHMPQSTAQVEQSSPKPQEPSPQNGQAPQSVGQLEQVSPSDGWHEKLPQLGGHGPQSAAQVKQLSVGPQVPSPQPAVGPTMLSV